MNRKIDKRATGSASANAACTAQPSLSPQAGFMSCALSAHAGWQTSKLAVMIDWLTCRITLPRPLPEPIHGGHFVRIDESGEVELSTPRRKRVAGSHEASLNIRACGLHELQIEGNPAKFLQGHNLWGSPDPSQLLWDALQRLEALGALPCTLASLGLVSAASVAVCTELSRVDCTVMLLGGSFVDVHEYLRSLRVAGRLRDRGASGLPHPWRGSMNVTFGASPGKSARHRSITFYAKGEEAMLHPLPHVMAADWELMDWVQRCLRCEVRLGSNYLRKKGLRPLQNWTAQTALQQWNEMMARVDMNGSEERPAALDDLPPRLQATYGAWLAGMDLQSIYSRSTYYDHRRELLKAIAVDIAIPKAAEPSAHIVPFKRIIELEPAGRPSCADRIDAMLAA